MNRLALTILMLAAALPAAAQDSQPQRPATQSQTTDGIVAIVGTHPILWSEVLEVIGQQRSQGVKLPTDSAGASQFARDVLEQLIDEQVLLQRAAGDTSITVADADLTQTVDRQVQQIRGQFPSEQEFLRQLRTAGFGSLDEYRKWMTEQARKSEMQRRIVQKYQSEGKMVRVAVSDAEVNEAYERQKANFPKRPPAVTFRQLVIAPQATQQALDKARAKAESLLVEIRRGGDFEQIARRESQDSASREIGGDLGWNRRGELVPEFEQMMFALAPGQVSPVVFTQSYGFHIIKVDRTKPAEVKARHILIKPDYTAADTARARARADSALAQWRSGVPYDTLSKKYHDRDEFEGSLEPFPRENLPESYRTAIGTKGKGEFVGPFAIPDRNKVVKFVVLQLTEVIEAGEYTVEEVRDRMRQNLSQERSFRRLLDQLKGETYVRIFPVEPFLAKAP